MYDVSISDCGGEGAMAAVYPEVNKSINSFLQNFESLSRLPFITDAEMALLYGEEVMAALEVLEQYNHQEKLCQSCRDRCCLLVKCELYSTHLKRCAVSSFRPALCRMHFCNKFALTNRELIKVIGDIFIDGLSAAGDVNRQVADRFDAPPLKLLAPELIDKLVPLIQSVEKHHLDETSALRIIQSEMEQFHTGNCAPQNAIIRCD